MSRVEPLRKWHKAKKCEAVVGNEPDGTGVRLKRCDRAATVVYHATDDAMSLGSFLCDECLRRIREKESK
jgi:hypothetical protein